ncbi:MAG: 6-chlorohydroxyquinol-1,2-dioxygenase [Pseudonocardiaceae bacterium]|nr:6-chlorohydroxyquinol-1,2-dioxygenase [Pseudonocardiaceae bacterium]
MAADFTEETAAKAVVDSFTDTRDPRLRQILTSLVEHLHGFVRDVEPSMQEWEQAIGFLTATGQMCSDTRQEFILLSDVLGVSMLVETLNDRKPEAVTDSTVLGPFHVVTSPRREFGDSIDEVGDGQPCVVTGRVVSVDGTPLPGAGVDVWQADAHGFYDVQRPDVTPVGNLRGLFTTDDGGAFEFRTVMPRHYPIPTDGPVGQLLTRTSRHPYRPAHIHFIAEAAGHHPVTTHVFVAGGEYLDTDAVFAVKQSLVRDFVEVDDPQQARRYGVTAPFRHVQFDIVLAPTGA